MRKTSGISLMLLIFLSLCLITFSLLSLSGAVADKNLSQKAADRTREYYRADTSANEQLARIDAQLAAYLKSAEESRTPEETYLAACTKISEVLPDVVWTSSDTDNEAAQNQDLTDSTASGTISFTIQVNDDQVLQAELLVTYPSAEDDTLYQITSWRVVNTRDWNADTSENVFLRSKTS